MSKNYKIAVIPGDGIGPEVMAECVKVLNVIAERDGSFSFEFTTFPWGCEYYLEHKEMMPENGIEILSKYDAILLGAVGYPGVPDHISLRDLLLRIRHDFDQYVNLRPVKLLEGAPCPLEGIKPEDVDMVFIRENSEGEYSGQGAWLYPNTDREVVIQDGVFSRMGCERIIRYAFELAKKEGKTLTSISKGNALNYSMVLWDRVFNDVSKEYPEVQTSSLLVDAAAMNMIKNPKRFQICVTSNLFGDILTAAETAVCAFERSFGFDLITTLQRQLFKLFTARKMKPQHHADTVDQLTRIKIESMSDDPRRHKPVVAVD